ncbi:hypothetical protein N0V87_000300 [Didymella glomerata]|uniref:Uncharacterized protein n=1 Tax=Didymella glomerata TaxID=749621 RepID=A0A9W8X881_9PLEO|nr:hypothetical protein N0V87_000300 [Didymella glomerata]
MKSTVIAFAFFAATFGAPTRRQTGNLQTFTGALGGIAATPVQNTGDAKRPFQVKGDTFVNLSGALARSCDQQFNACANAANGGDKTLSTAQCTSQKDQCDAASQSGAAAQGSAQAGGANNAQAGGANNAQAGGANNAQAGGANNANKGGNANAGGNNAANNNANAGANNAAAGNTASCT